MSILRWSSLKRCAKLMTAVGISKDKFTRSRAGFKQKVIIRRWRCHIANLVRIEFAGAGEERFRPLIRREQ